MDKNLNQNKIKIGPKTLTTLQLSIPNKEKIDLNTFIEITSKKTNLSKNEAKKLFFEVDLDGDNIINWDEFVNNFVFSENLNEESNSEIYLLKKFGNEIENENENENEKISSLCFLNHQNKYISTGNNGIIKLWSSSSLECVKSIQVNQNNTMLTDSCKIENDDLIAISSCARKIHLYHLPSFDFIDEIVDIPNIPLCLHSWSNYQDKFLSFGDEKGQIFIMKKMINSEKKFFKINNNNSIKLIPHKDWISQIKLWGNIGILSSSYDKTLKITDIENQSVIETLEGHEKACFCFDTCSSLGFIASGGLERSILIWSPHINKPTMILSGHTSSIVKLIVLENENLLASLSLDKSIKLWDIRNFQCVQTIQFDSFQFNSKKKKFTKSNSLSTCMIYDNKKEQIVTASNKLTIWKKNPNQNLKSNFLKNQFHQDKIINTLYNETFQQIYCIDERAKMSIWNILNGKIENQIQIQIKEKVSNVIFDKFKRKLIIGCEKGFLYIVNPSNGKIISKVQQKNKIQINKILYSFQKETNEKQIISFGLSKDIYIWKEYGNGLIKFQSKLTHKYDDICSVCLCFPNLIISSDWKGNIFIWNLNTFQLYDSFQYFSNLNIQLLQFLDSINSLIIIGKFGLIIWSLDLKKILFDYYNEENEEKNLISFTSICLDDSQSLLLLGDSNGIISIWEIINNNKKNIQLLLKNFWQIENENENENENEIIGLSFIQISNQKFILSNSNFNVYIWNLNGICLGKIGNEEKNWNLFSNQSKKEKEKEEKEKKLSSLSFYLNFLNNQSKKEKEKKKEKKKKKKKKIQIMKKKMKKKKIILNQNLFQKY
ncbi:wd40 repeat domain 95 [Anaeramoeba ignava]|uniref:Wd40 repeat domain 95 n=1 Tax=Anaeramoeba ignava TaxID=1746090 RepID=A0A9Q0R7F9_ANAIG|nr:wd40 repeat domain 95 [Anaeramoeba ignava]